MAHHRPGAGVRRW